MSLIWIASFSTPPPSPSEGEGGEAIGELGTSKNHRPDLNQIVVGAILDDHGQPVCCEMWSRNTTDVTTLVPVIKRLRSRFQIEKICVVSDRGMISAEAMAYLEEEKTPYILSTRMRRSKEVKEEVLSRAGRYREVHPEGVSAKDPSPLKVKEVIVDGNRPIAEGRYPVILTYGIYAKGLSYQEGYPHQWKKMVEDHPEILEGSTNKYQNWEVTDPERWVPHGYVVIRIDSRGAGWSPGFMSPHSSRETEDIYQCIEWAGTKSWSNGKVGMLGISYYARNQWEVAARNPPHLTALIPWEGGNDRYRDSSYHGGILSQFQDAWSRHQVTSVQYGRGEKARKNPNTGESVAGPITLSDEELAANRINSYQELKKHPFDDEWHRDRSADLSKITVPFLSCANWGGQGIHPRGNFNAFIEAPAKQKWLEAHGDSHWSLFSSSYGLNLQKRFFDYFLKGIDNGWDKTTSVMLNIRHPGERFVLRYENEWPLARTCWRKFYLDPANLALSPDAVAKEGTVTYEGLGNGVTFRLPKLDTEMEITGPLAAKLFVSSSTRDADLFLILRVFDPDGKELTFMGSTDPNTPIANGWLRASHRQLVPEKTTPYRPYHPHDRAELLTPGEVYECDVEIISTCIVVPAGWQVALTIRGKDYEYEGELSEFAKQFHYATRGTGGMTHNDPDNRPPEVFGGKVTLHAGGDWGAYLLLPIIPPKDEC